MTATATRFTEAEYLACERAAEFRSEYYRGEMFAMAGATEEHEIISTNITGLFWLAFRGRPCKAYGANMRVKVSPTGLYTYPDLSALCAEPEFLDQQFDTLTNPQVLIEILSKSTAGYDRGTKADHYRRLPSLREHLLIEQTRPHVDVYRRGKGKKWEFEAFEGLDAVIELASVQVTLPLRDIYDRVVFAEIGLKDQ